MSEPEQLPYDPRQITEVRYPEGLPDHILLNKILSQLAVAHLEHMGNTGMGAGAMVNVDGQRYLVWVDKAAKQLRIRRVEKGDK
jgi:hypothetical protein